MDNFEGFDKVISTSLDFKWEKLMIVLIWLLNFLKHKGQDLLLASYKE